MNKTIILDTGPLVAFLDRREQHHAQVNQFFKEQTLPFATCEPVITEACFILGHMPQAIQQIGRWISEGVIKIDFSLSHDNQQVFGLMKKYRDLPMSLADACLVTMCKLQSNCRIFTLDSHFHIYRTSTRKIIKTIGLD